MSETVVVRTGTANLASVVAALARLDARPVLAEDPKIIEDARRLVLPGVGTFAAAMGRLEQLGLVEILRRRIDADRPTLAICLGMQVLCESSEESSGVSGIGAIPGARVTRFGDHVRVPQLGWNKLEADEGCDMLADGYAYFANSYRLEDAPGGWSVARCDYGGKFIGALEKGNVLACQFHPELSSTFGAGLLGRWLQRTQGGES